MIENKVDYRLKSLEDRLLEIETLLSFFKQSLGGTRTALKRTNNRILFLETNAIVKSPRKPRFV